MYVVHELSCMTSHLYAFVVDLLHHHQSVCKQDCSQFSARFISSLSIENSQINCVQKEQNLHVVVKLSRSDVKVKVEIIYTLLIDL